MNWKPFLAWASEKSTVIGLLSALSLIGGWVISPDQINSIATITTTVAAGAAILMREK